MILKVYGPYKRPDGRRHIIWYDTETGTRRTQSYSRFLMENFLGRKLESWEQVDHINENPSDDRIENYQILDIGENIRKNTNYRRITGQLQPEWYEFICPVCLSPAMIPYRYYKGNQLVQRKAGPYCSRICAGIRYP
jgi:hypothetical protein